MTRKKPKEALREIKEAMYIILCGLGQQVCGRENSLLKDDVNGGYVISSTVYRGSNSNMDFCLIKTDTAGHVLWVHTYGGEKDEHCYDMDLTLDGGYVLAGHTNSPPSVGWDALIIKVNKFGNLEWKIVLGNH